MHEFALARGQVFAMQRTPHLALRLAGPTTSCTATPCAGACRWCPRSRIRVIVALVLRRARRAFATSLPLPRTCTTFYKRRPSLLTESAPIISAAATGGANAPIAGLLTAAAFRALKHARPHLAHLPSGTALTVKTAHDSVPFVPTFSAIIPVPALSATAAFAATTGTPHSSSTVSFTHVDTATTTGSALLPGTSPPVLATHVALLLQQAAHLSWLLTPRHEISFAAPLAVQRAEAPIGAP